MGLTVSAAARVLNVSSQTVVAYSERGILRAFRSSGGWRYFDPKEVEKLAAERQKKFAQRGGIR